MNARVLIDNIVRQTTVLIAQLATAAGLRAPLAHVANQVFLDLVTRLEADGLGRKVVADMFGMALRSYQLKVRRLSESNTDQNKTLWQALLEHLKESGTLTRAEVLARFQYDEEASVRGILRDLVDSGLVYRSGRGHTTTFRAATQEDLERATSASSGPQALAPLVWVTVHRLGRATEHELLGALILDRDTLRQSLDLLVADGRVERDDGSSQGPIYQTASVVLSFGSEVGWGAAVFDHYQALVGAVCAKLDRGKTRAELADAIGGSTYHFDIWPGHPDEVAVQEQFARLRSELSELRTQVSNHSENNTPPAGGASRYTLYLGQLVRDEMNWTDNAETD